MNKRVSLFLVPVLVLAACGGGGDGSADGAASDTWCAMAQRIEDSSERYDAAFDDGGQSLGEALGEFTSLLNDAKGSAPSDIREEVETAADGIGRFDELLGDVEYDVFELDESVFAELEGMGDEMDAATDKIEAYNLKECGIGSDESSSDEPAEPADEAAELAVADDDLADDGVADEVVPDDDMADADDVTFSGDSNSQWCVANRELDVVSDDFNDLFLAEPDVLEAKLTEMLGLVEAAVSFAPPELAGDVAVSLTAMRQLETALIAAEYDILNADLSVLDVNDAGQVANDNIEAYNEQVCGIIDDDDDSTVEDDDDDGFQAGAGTIRDQAVAELVDEGFTRPEAECVFDNIDFTDPEFGNDPSAMISVFDDCGLDLARLAELGG